MKKIISLVLCVVMMITLFTACDRTMTMEEILKDTNIVVGKVADQEVYAYEMLYLMSMGYDAETAFEELVTLKVMAQKAADNGVTLSEEEVKTLDEQLGAMVEQYGGKEAFEQILSSAALTYDQYKNIITLSETVTKFNGEAVNLGLFTEATEEEAKAVYEGNFIKAKHILFSTMNAETGEALSEEEAAAKKKLADETLAKIKAGEEFEKFAELNEDPGSLQQPEGYVFAVTANIKDEKILSAIQQVGYSMVPEFEKGAYELEVGAVSEVIPTNYGYHIIKRVEMTAEDYEGVKQNIINVLNNEKYLSEIENWKTEYKIKKNEKIIASINMEEYQQIMAEKEQENAANAEPQPEVAPEAEVEENPEAAPEAEAAATPETADEKPAETPAE